MYRVLLVDDEALVKIGLKGIINWNELGFEIIGEASNGEEGLQMIMERHPHLVITDMVMPNMDGIEMMEKALTEANDIVFIALSSYDEFNLVKKAMRLGAMDYLLKLNLNEESVKEMLQTVRGVLDKRNISNMGFYTQISEKAMFFKMLLEEKCSQKELQAEAKRLRLKLAEEKLSIILFAPARESVGKKSLYGNSNFRASMSSMIHDICKEFFVNICTEWYNGSYLLILTVPENNTENLIVMCEDIIEMFKQYSNIDIYAGISEEVNGFANLREAYAQVSELMSKVFWTSSSKIFFCRESGLGLSEEDDEIFSLEKLEKIFLTGDARRLASYNRDAIRHMRELHLQKRDVCFQCGKYVHYMEEILGEEWNNWEKKEEIYEYVYQIYHYDVLDNVLETMGKIFQLFESYLEIKSNYDTNLLVRKTKQYVKEHIYENILVKNIAEELHVSAGYLSSVFSKSESISLINYVNKVKIEEAKNMLKNGNYKVYEVSFQLGYENAGYFTKVFKKYTGLSPSEYTK